MKLFTTACLLFLFANLFSQAQIGTLLGTWNDQSLPSSSAHDNRYNEIWGVVNDGREYAVIGTTWGTHFIDVTDATNPVEVAKVQGKTSGASVVHRDYHDFEGYIYAVCDEGQASTMQIIDFTTLPDSVSVVYDSPELIRRAHNIFIDQDNAKLYGLISYGPLAVFDLEDPVNPTLVGSYSSIEGLEIPAGSHDAFIKDNIAYINVGYKGLIIADFTKPDSATLITTLLPSEYPQSGYNHSGWLSEDGGFYYMADENHGKAMKVVDVRELPDTRIDVLFDAESTSPSSIPHNQVVAGDYLYVSYYFDGLQVYDISNPGEPIRIMHYPTSSRTHQASKYQGAWGVYPFLPSGNILVSDMQEGLFVVESVDKLTSSLDELIEDITSIIISPNPSIGSFELQHENEKFDEVNLMNLDGKILQSWPNSESYIIQDNIPNGLYYISFSQSGNFKSQALLLNR